MLTDHDDRDDLREPSSEQQHSGQQTSLQPRSPQQSPLQHGPSELLRLACRDADGATLLSLLRALAPRCGYSGRELARLLGVSPRHLQRLFATRVQRCPQRLLKEERLLSAQELLRTASSVKEVAYGLGFRQASQFSRDYKHHFGVQPSVVRNDAASMTRAGSGPGSSARNASARTRSAVSSPSLNQR